MLTELSANKDNQKSTVEKNVKENLPKLSGLAHKMNSILLNKFTDSEYQVVVEKMKTFYNAYEKIYNKFAEYSLSKK